MKGDFDELMEFERALSRLHEGLRGGEAFLRSRGAAYRQAAEVAAMPVLRAMRPANADPAEWESQVKEFAEFLSWKASTGGIEIFYQKYQEREESGLKQRIGFSDVLEWVKAGAEHGGKDKTEAEVAAGKPDEEIAYVVTKAINQYRFGFAENSDYSRITERLEEWVKQRFLSGDLSAVLSEVLDVWVTVLGKMIEEDFEKWVDEQLERL